LKRLEKAIALAAPGPVIIEIVNDPERRRAGPDEAELAGHIHQRLEGEDRGAFHARLQAAAVATDQRLVCVSLAMAANQGPFLDDFKIENLVQAQTVEIGSPEQPDGRAIVTSAPAPYYG
jgi:hypothetical protein